jgi:PhzF family phenazine biosynthesis protein
MRDSARTAEGAGAVPIRITQVDAFTDRPFAGNPAAVCIVDAATDAAWMQRVAREMNLSETAFLHPEADGYRLRWFTPAVEVDLCGHATLASAHVLWEEGHLEPGQSARFHTRSGLLTADRAADGIWMDFPAAPPSPAETLPELEQALGAPPVYVGRSRFDTLVEVESEDVVRALRPDIAALRNIPARGVIVTARSESPEFDFVSRFFAPAVGVDEDPVTGSAHCVLAPYWAERLERDDLTGYQASDRGGVVRVRLRGDRVLLGGQAVTVLRGELVPEPA